MALGACPQVPFNLHDFKDAPHDVPIFICEGEKDAMSVTKLDLLATTKWGGAGKWPQELNSYFTGRIIYILPDNDLPGRKHAQLVARNLFGVAAEVRIVELPNLPDKEDVSWWLANGGTKAELLKLCKAAPAVKADDLVEAVILDPNDPMPSAPRAFGRPVHP